MKVINKKEANKIYPKRRGYYYFDTPDGEKQYPSITSILKVLDKPGLMYWAVKEVSNIALDDPSLSVEEVGSKFRSILTDAGTRGKGVHNFFHRILLGEDVIDYLEQYKDYIEPIKQFKKDYTIEPLWNEKIVKSDLYKIAGTTDEGTIINGRRALLDLKTSKYVYPENGLQLGFYQQALKEEGEIFEDIYVLHVPGDGTYSLVQVKGNMEIVIALKKVWEWVNKKNEG